MNRELGMGNVIFRNERWCKLKIALFITVVKLDAKLDTS